MKVKVGPRVYEMSDNAWRKLLKDASGYVPVGIYAIEKPGQGYAELMNLPGTKTRTKEERRKFKSQGWKVYCNL